MQHITQAFEDLEFEELRSIKEDSKKNWHDFILESARLFKNNKK